MNQYAVGDRVVLRSCTGCAPGTVMGIHLKRIEVLFDDLAPTRWLLRPESLQPAGEARG